MVFDTSRLEAAYDRYGNIAHVEGWFKAECFRPGMRIAEPPGTVKKLDGRPKWWCQALRFEGCKYPPLSLSTKLETAIIQRGGTYPDIFPETALELEKIARKQPRLDWRVDIIEAFESRVYQRQGRNKWVLIESGKGYA